MRLNKNIVCVGLHVQNTNYMDPPRAIITEVTALGFFKVKWIKFDGNVPPDETYVYSNFDSWEVIAQPIKPSKIKSCTACARTNNETNSCWWCGEAL